MLQISANASSVEENVEATSPSVAKEAKVISLVPRTEVALAA